MGRKALPAHLHIVQGNKSHQSKEELDRRKDAEESMQFADDLIKSPTWLRKEARKYFTKLVKEFENSGLLKNVDVNALALYCDALHDYVEFTNIIAEEGYTIEMTNKAGATNSIPHPLIAKKTALFQQMSKLMGEFGLTPSARASLARTLVAEDKDEDNSFSGRV